jgi:phosphoglycolate phosphatase-like HAD superfamily hydrolase
MLEASTNLPATGTMQLKGLIFDLDGTLGDTLPVCFAAFRETFRSYLGRDYDDREIRAMFGPNEEGIFQNLLGERWEEGLRHYLDSYRKAHAQCPEPFTGMRGALDLLRASEVRLAVVTGKGPRSAELSLEALGLTNVFDMVEAGSAQGGVKPRCMSKVVAAWGLDPGNVACLGDAPSDIRSARQIGAVPLGAAWASTADYETLRALEPHDVFRNVDEFTRWASAMIASRAGRSNGNPPA